MCARVEHSRSLPLRRYVLTRLRTRDLAVCIGNIFFGGALIDTLLHNLQLIPPPPYRSFSALHMRALMFPSFSFLLPIHLSHLPQIRARAMSLATAANRFTAFMVAMTFLSFSESVGTGFYSLDQYSTPLYDVAVTISLMFSLTH